MKEYLNMKDAFWCKIKFGNYGVRCFIEASDPPCALLISGMLRQQDMPHMLSMNMRD